MVRSYLTVLVIALPALAQGPEVQAVKPPALPEKLAAKPGTDAVLKLRIELHNTMLEELKGIDDRITQGVWRSTEHTDRADVFCKLLDVAFEIETDPQRKAKAIEGMVENAAWMEAHLKARGNLDNPTLYPLAKARRLELEIRLGNYKKSIAK